MMIIDSFTFVTVKCSHFLVFSQRVQPHWTDFEIIPSIGASYPHVPGRSITHIWHIFSLIDAAHRSTIN